MNKIGERFGKLEQPAEEKSPLTETEELDRFQHLEIGDCKFDYKKTIVKEIPSNKTKCPKCGALADINEKLCNLCAKSLEKSNPEGGNAELLTIVIDGKEYRSDMEILPSSVKWLMSQIRTEGYSEELLKEWQRMKEFNLVWKREEVYLKNRDRLLMPLEEYKKLQITEEIGESARETVRNKLVYTSLGILVSGILLSIIIRTSVFLKLSILCLAFYLILNYKNLN